MTSDEDCKNDAKKERQSQKDLSATLGAAEILCQIIYRLVDKKHALYRMAKSLDMCLSDFYESRAKEIAEVFGDWVKNNFEDNIEEKEKG